MELKHEQKFSIKTHVDVNGLFEEIGEMLKIRKIINTVFREKNEYQEFCFRLVYKIQTVELVWPRAQNE